MRLHNLKGLRTLMVVREISQRRLAGAAGYRSHTYMGRILRGEVDTLAPEAASRIAKYLQVSLDYLFAPSAPVNTTHFEHHHWTSSTQEAPGPGVAHSRIQGRDR